MKEEEEFYARQIFRVRDVEASVAYYCDKLGFTKGWQHGSDRLIIAQVGRNGLDIILDSDSVVPKPGATSVLSMSVHDLGALYGELQDRGAKIVRAPFPVAWQEGVYELDVQDLDGNVLVFWGDPPK